MDKRAPKKDVLIVIVDYFKADKVITNVLRALEQKTSASVRVVIIDNSCCNSNFEKLRLLESYGVTLIKNSTNVGYSRACNQGANTFNSDFVFLVNPDIAWQQENTIERIIKEFEVAKDIGILGVKQVNEDGTIPQTVRRFPQLATLIARRTFLGKIRWFKNKVRYYEHQHFNYDESADVDWIQSSFVAIKTELWRKINGLDERFFIFMADPDVCFRIRKEGFRVRYLSDVFVGADGKRCSEGRNFSIFTNRVIRYHLTDALRYHFKYRGERVEHRYKADD